MYVGSCVKSSSYNVEAAYSPEPIIRQEDATSGASMDTMKVNWAIRMASTGYYKSFTPAAADIGDYATRGPVGNIGTMAG